MSGELHQYFLRNNGNTIDKWFHYFDIYERHFERFRNKNPVILEIGVFEGGSLQMWKNYFGDCKIIGMDINPDCKKYEEDGIEVFIGSQDDPNVINQILSKYPHIDIVIDDGGHFSVQMRKCFELLYNKISNTGVYLVEDTHACYWSNWGGDLKHPNSFVEFAKDKIDEVNAGAASKENNKVRITDVTRSTDSITFYDSVIVFEKRPQGLKQSARTKFQP